MTSAKQVAADHLHRLSDLFEQIDLDALERVFSLLQAARDNGSTIYIAGNGGSAATAAHWANDLGKATKRSGRAPMRVMSLGDNLAWMTALANDEGYDRVFTGQLENFARPGDLLVVISASGSSPNVVRAVETAKQLGVSTVGLLGFDGGSLKTMVDELVWVPTEQGDYELAEDCHMTICHILARSLALDRLPSESAVR